MYLQLVSAEVPTLIRLQANLKSRCKKIRLNAITGQCNRLGLTRPEAMPHLQLTQAHHHPVPAPALGVVGQVEILRGGAALGAIGGAITGGNVGKSAAIGAAAGGLFGGARRSSRKKEEERWQEHQRQQQAQQQQAFQQEVNARTDDYRRAYTVCMSSRNYTVQ